MTTIWKVLKPLVLPDLKVSARARCGLDLNSEENADWINMYIDWHPDDTIHAYVSYCNSSTDDPDFTLEVIMSPHHQELFNAYFKEQFKAVYHMSVEEAWAKFGTE